MSSIRVLWLFSVRSYTYLRLKTQCLIFLCVLMYVGDTVFLISNPNCSLVVYGKTIDFYILTCILQFCYNLQEIIVLGVFLLILQDMLSVLDSFISSFLICIPFISFPCLTALAKISSVNIKEEISMFCSHSQGENLQFLVIKYEYSPSKFGSQLCSLLNEEILTVLSGQHD